MIYVVMRVNPCMERCKSATDIIGPLSMSAILISRVKIKRGTEQKQHETSDYGIRWSRKKTLSAAALAIFLREVFSLTESTGTEKQVKFS